MMQQNPLSDDDLRRAFDAADRMAQQGDQQATEDARAFAQELQRRGLLGQQQPSARPQLPEWPEDVADRQAREANPQQPQRERTGVIPAFSRGNANVFYLGAADELAGGLENLFQRGANLFRAPDDRVDPNEAGRNATQEVRRLEREAREDRPVAYGTGQVSGGVIQATTAGVSGRAIAPAVASRYGAAVASRPIATVAGTGAVEGGIYGFNEAEGGIRNRAMGALGGSVLGAIAGPATMGAIGLGRQGVNWARGQFPGAAQAVDQGVDEARRGAVRFAERFGLGREIRNNPAALADNGGDFVAERIGPRGRMGAAYVAGRGDEAQGIAEDAIANRAAGRSGRVEQAAQGATQQDQRGVVSLMGLDEVRQQAAPLFNQADEQMIRLTPNMREAMRRLNEAGVSFRDADRLARVQGGGRVQLSAYADDIGSLPDRVRLGDLRALAQAAEDMASREFRAGSGQMGRGVANASRELRDGLRQNPQYREAAQLWASAARDEEAFNIGQQIFRPGAQQERDLRRFVTSGTSQTERRMFLAGIADAIEQRMGNGSVQGNAASRLNPARIRDRLQRFLGDDAADELIQRLDIENAQAGFENLINRQVNSATSFREEAMRQGRQAESGALRNFIASSIDDTGSFLRNIGGLRTAVGRFIRNGDDEDIAEVARLLFSTGDVSNDPLVRALMREAERRGVLPGGASLALVAPAQDALTSRDQ